MREAHSHPGRLFAAGSAQAIPSEGRRQLTPPATVSGKLAQIQGVAPETGPLHSEQPEVWLAQQGALRRRRLVRQMAGTVCASLCVLFPLVLFPSIDRVSTLAVSVGVLAACLAYVLARSPRVDPTGTLGAYILIGGAILANLVEQVGIAYQWHGLPGVQLRVLDLFVVPIVAGVILLPRAWAMAVLGTTLACTVGLALVLPRGTDLQAFVTSATYADGSLLNIIAMPAALQVVLFVVMRLAVRSAERGFREALRADALEEANSRILQEHELLVAERQRLQHGIGQIQQAYTAVLRGHREARVQTVDPAILPLALSFNLLLDRIARLSKENDEYQRLTAAVRELETALNRRDLGLVYRIPPPSGTPLDALLTRSLSKDQRNRQARADFPEWRERRDSAPSLPINRIPPGDDRTDVRAPH